MCTSVLVTETMYAFARQSRSDSLGVGIPKTKCVRAQGMDQPIYAIAKQIQWKGTDTLVENKFVLMLGALHIEFVIEAVKGQLVDGFGYLSVISEAGVLTPVRAEAVSSPTPDHHLKRMR